MSNINQMMNQTPNGKKTVLITGASGGIGLELARVFARNGYDLILVARTEKALTDLANELRKQYATKSTIIAKDLSVPGAPDEVFTEVEKQNIAVDVLVNNAGFATYGPFAELPVRGEVEMMQLNIVALTHLTRLFLSGMKSRGFGKIMNLGSTASFLPGPLMTVYYASKAYVLSFSQALATELKGTGISVTALCPGPTKSGFQSRAELDKSKLLRGATLMTSEAVAEFGYDALMKGKPVAVPGFSNKLVAILGWIVPREWAAQLVMNMQGRVSHS